MLAVVVAGANALQRTQPPRRRTVRFSDAAPEAETVEAAPLEPQMVAAPVETPEERAARDEDGPLKEFDWDAHLARIEADDERARAAAAEEERQALAGGDEWLGDDLDQLQPEPVVDDEPEFLKPRWDEVDPADVDFRYDLGVPRCCGAFTPSTRVVSRRGGCGWSLFRF